MATASTAAALTVAPSLTASQLATFFASTHQKAAAVVERGSSVICGVVSARDVLTRVLARSSDPSRTTVSEFMTGDPLVISEAEHVNDADLARRLMCERGFRHLPVVADHDSRRYVNLLTLTSETRAWNQRQPASNNFVQRLQSIGSSLAQLVGWQLEEDGDSEDDSAVSDEQDATRAVLAWRLQDLWPAASTEPMLSSSNTLRHAVDYMTRHSVGCVLVHAPEDPYRLAGVLSETDIVVRALAMHATEDDVLARPIGEFWSTGDIITLASTQTVGAALGRMLERSLRHLPIVDPATSEPKMVLDLVLLARQLLVSSRPRSNSSLSANSFDREEATDMLESVQMLEASLQQSTSSTSQSDREHVMRARDMLSPQKGSHGGDAMDGSTTRSSVTGISSHGLGDELELEPRAFALIRKIHNRLATGRTSMRQLEFSSAYRKFSLTDRLLAPAIQSASSSFSESPSENGAILLACLHCLRVEALAHSARACFIMLSQQPGSSSASSHCQGTLQDALQNGRDAIMAHAEYMRCVKKSAQAGFSNVAPGDKFLPSTTDASEQLLETGETHADGAHRVLERPVQLLPEDANVVLSLDLCDYLLQGNEFEEVQRIVCQVDVESFADRPCKASAATQAQVRSMLLSKIRALVAVAHMAQGDVREALTASSSSFSPTERAYMLTKAMRAVAACRAVAAHHSWAFASNLAEAEANQGCNADDKDPELHELYTQLVEPHELHMERATQSFAEAGLPSNSTAAIAALMNGTLSLPRASTATVNNGLHDCYSAISLAPGEASAYLLGAMASVALDRPLDALTLLAQGVGATALAIQTASSSTLVDAKTRKEELKASHADLGRCLDAVRKRHLSTIVDRPSRSLEEVRTPLKAVSNSASASGKAAAAPSDSRSTKNQAAAAQIAELQALMGCTTDEA